MTPLVERVKQGLSRYNPDYFCLELTEADSPEEISKILPLFQKRTITQLDIVFSETLKKDPASMQKLLAVIIPGVKGTTIKTLDLSCNALDKIGIAGMCSLFALTPSNINTYVLSGNNWEALQTKAEELLQQLSAAFKQGTLLFEGTKPFERELSRLQRSATRVSGAVVGTEGLFGHSSQGSQASQPEQAKGPNF